MLYQEIRHRWYNGAESPYCRHLHKMSCDACSRVSETHLLSRHGNKGNPNGNSVVHRGEICSGESRRDHVARSRGLGRNCTQSLYRVGNHSNRSRHLFSYYLLGSNQVHEPLHVEGRSEEKHVRDRDACALNVSDSHQRGIPINECAVEGKGIIQSRAAILESSTCTSPSQLGSNEADLNAARFCRFGRLGRI